jgi:hypothetical protein
MDSQYTPVKVKHAPRPKQERLVLAGSPPDIDEVRVNSSGGVCGRFEGPDEKVCHHKRRLQVLNQVSLEAKQSLTAGASQADLILPANQIFSPDSGLLAWVNFRKGGSVHPWARSTWQSW